MGIKLIAIGELLIDFFMEDKASFKANPGGAPANVAVAVSKLGGNALMLTKVGEDYFGSFLIDCLKSYKVDTSRILRTNEANTALAFVNLDKDGERHFTFYRSPSADMLLNENEIKPEIFNRGDILHFCSVDLVDYPVRKAHLAALKYASSRGCLICFDPNLRYNLWPSKEELLETVNSFISYADIVKVSQEELEAISGLKNREEGIKKLFRGNVKLVIVTLGKDGAEAYTLEGEKIVSKGIKPEKVVDTTGAGDTFIGAFLYRIMEGKKDFDSLLEERSTLNEYLDFANKAASFCLLSKGAMTSMPSKGDIPLK
ncbi:MAG: carbohydrate kinase [Bacilli bacterium]|nr:carbohydrate kinase [Bacilli bacterium]